MRSAFCKLSGPGDFFTFSESIAEAISVVSGHVKQRLSFSRLFLKAVPYNISLIYEFVALLILRTHHVWFSSRKSGIRQLLDWSKQVAATMSVHCGLSIG